MSINNTAGRPATIYKHGSGIFAAAGQTGGMLPALAYNLAVVVERRLPGLGEVVVNTGHRVDSDTMLAHTMLPGKPRVYNLADYLETPARKIARLLRQEAGSSFKQGQVLAKKGLLLGRRFRAPFDGLVSALDEAEGLICLTPQAQPYYLDAFVSGMVVEKVPGYGVNIQTQVNYARGAFGFGGERHGVLRVASSKPSEGLDPAAIDKRSTNLILLGGSYATAATLQKALEHKVRGIIIGSLREEELTAFLQYRQRTDFYRTGQHDWRFPADLDGETSPFTLIVTEGFGQRPMAGRLFEMLLTHDGGEISINGQTLLRPGSQPGQGWQRPEILVPVLSTPEINRPASRQGQSETMPRLGSIVRLLNPTYLGVVGRVTGLPAARRGTATGQLERLAEVEAAGTRLILPFADLEVIEQPGR